jgi:O-antigen/teichoic acid export membrane protein
MWNRIFWVMVSGWGARLSSIITNIVVIPLLISLLGTSEYAVLSILLSLMVWFNLFDFGIGNSLHNYMVEGNISDKDSAHYMASAYVLITIVLLLGTLLICLFGEYLGELLFSRMYFLPDITRSRLVVIVCVLLLFNSMGQIANRILFAQGKGYIPNILQIISNVFVLIIFYVISFSSFKGDIIKYAVAYLAPIPVLLLITLVIIGFKNNLWYSGFNRHAMIALLQRSRKFWLYTLLATFICNIDYIILSQTVSIDSIAAYSIVYKISVTVISISTSMLHAIWPLAIEWITKNDWHKLTNIINKYMLIGFFSILCFFTLLTLFQRQIFLLLAPGANLMIEFSTIILFTMYLIIRVWTDIFTVLIQAINDINNLIFLACFQAIASIILQIVLAQIWGVNGILVGLILSSILTVSWALPLRLKKIKSIGYKNITKGQMTVLPIIIKQKN